MTSIELLKELFFVPQVVAAFRKRKSGTRLPHEIYPEILQWRAGDSFDLDSDYSYRTLVSIQPDGYAVLNFCGQQRYVHVGKLIGLNASARNRRIDADVIESHEYMDLLKAFNESVDELKERDKKLKLVS